MTAWQIYLITRLEYIQGFFFVICIFAGIATVILSIAVGAAVYDDDDSEIIQLSRRLLIRSVTCALFCGATAALIPNSQEIAAIIIIPKISNAISKSTKLQELPDNILSLANDWLKELKPNKEK